MSDEVKVYYMRDNHTFLPVPLYEDQAMAVLMREFLTGTRRGMLCSKHPKLENSSVNANGKWEDFEDPAREFMRQAIALAAIEQPKPGKNSRYEIEPYFRVYDNKTGEFVQVGPDCDALGLVELVVFDDPTTPRRMVLGKPEQALLVAQAIVEMCERLERGDG